MNRASNVQRWATAAIRRPRLGLAMGRRCAWQAAVGVQPRQVRFAATATAKPQPFMPTSHAREHGGRDYGSVEEFQTLWVQYFNECPEQFDLHIGLNNVFAYDIIPTAPIVDAALRAARRLDDLGSAMRLVAGIRDKCNTKKQYKAYLDYFQEQLEEMGVPTPEAIGR